jgi:hypothetical protein
MTEKKAKKDKPLDLKGYLIAKLRSASRKWPPTNEAKKKMKVEVRVEFDEKSMMLKVFLDNGKLYQELPVIKKAQSRDRVMYRCEQCGRLFFDYEILKNKKGTLKKTAIVAIDHVNPIIDPAVGFVSWDVYIDRMFNGDLQILCNYPGERDGVESCHHIKTAVERGIMAERIAKEKGLDPNAPKKTKKKEPKK